MLFLRQTRLLCRQARRNLRPRPQSRRIVVHIGAHKTGSTYIQHTLEANRARLPLAFETVPRRDRRLYRLTDLAASARPDADLAALALDLTDTAHRLAIRFGRVENLLITHEGLPGPLPGRPQFPGLYPMAHVILPAIIRGLSLDGAEVSVILYKRRFKDWQTSLYRYRFRHQPDRGYNPPRFADRTGMPGNWDDLVARLRQSLPATTLTVVSYEQDRGTGLLGHRLYQEFGLSETQIAKLKRLPPRNVSRAHTKHDYQFEN